PSDVRPLIPIQPEPAKVVDRRPDRLRARPRSVQILDAQNHAPARVSGRQPGNQKSARMPEVKSSGRRRRQPADDLCVRIRNSRQLDHPLTRIRTFEIDLRRELTYSPRWLTLSQDRWPETIPRQNVTSRRASRAVSFVP